MGACVRRRRTPAQTVTSTTGPHLGPRCGLSDRSGVLRATAARGGHRCDGHDTRQPHHTTSARTGWLAPTRAEQEEPWLDQVPVALPVARGRLRAGPGRSTTTASSPSSPAPFVRSKPQHSAAPSRRRTARSSRRVALLMREERARVKADATLTDSQRAEQLKRLDGVATIIAKTAARDTSVIQLLTEEAPVSEATRTVKRDMMIDAGLELQPEDLVIAAEPTAAVEAPERQVVPQSVEQSSAVEPVPGARLRARRPARRAPAAPGELGALRSALQLLRVRRRRGSGLDAPARAPTLQTPAGASLMIHQAGFVDIGSAGHRTFLLADEPGLGKTAQSLIAANVPRPSRCSWSCRTSSRPTGPARSRAGSRTAAPRSSTATATTSTRSPTSSS